MALQVNVNDILSQLYQHRDVVQFLFANRENITVNELLSREDINDEQYQKLKSLELVYEYESIVSLNDAVIAMFEDFMEIGEVTPGFITDYINELKRNIRFYQEVHEHRFLRAIKKYLKRISIALPREIIRLQKNIDDTYKNEANYRIKIQKLEDYRVKRDTIIDLIHKTGEIIEDTRSLFNLTNDSELYGIVVSLKAGLIENLDYLIEIQTDITDYINKIQFQLDVYVKAQRLKEIKDHGALHYRSNFTEVVKNLSALRFNNVKGPRTKIAINFLFTDDGHVLCKKVAEKYKLSRLMIRGIAGKLPSNFKDQLIDNQIKLDVEKLVQRFLTQTKFNLFEYLMDYKFPKAVGNVTFEDRLSLFVEIAMEHQNVLDFKYRLNYFDYEDNEKKKKRLGYTIIVPMEKQEKKTKKEKAG